MNWNGNNRIFFFPRPTNQLKGIPHCVEVAGQYKEKSLFYCAAVRRDKVVRRGGESCKNIIVRVRNVSSAFASRFMRDKTPDGRCEFTGCRVLITRTHWVRTRTGPIDRGKFPNNDYWFFVRRFTHKRRTEITLQNAQFDFEKTIPIHQPWLSIRCLYIECQISIIFSLKYR